MSLALAPMLIAVVAAARAEPSDWAGCTVVRIAADGRRTETPPRAAPVRPSGTATAAASSNGRAGSSVSVSTRSDGRSTASATSSARSEDGRSVTVTRDADGCVVTIDER